MPCLPPLPPTLVLQVVLGGVMKAWGVAPNQLSYNTIMDAYARTGNVNNVVKIYNFMQVSRSEGRLWWWG